MSRIDKRDGFALPSAIFLLVILAALGAFILNISTSQQIGSALDIEGERAYQSAYGGMEWARYRLWNGAVYPIPSGAHYCPGGADAWNNNQTTSLSFSGTLASFMATVECRRLQDTDVSGVQTQVYEIRVTACNKPQATEPRCPPADPVAGNSNANSSTFGYVERQMTGLISL